MGLKQRVFTLDDAADGALDIIASALGTSRSDVVRKLAILAQGAVCWHAADLDDPVAAKAAAVRGCEEWGLFTLSRDWPTHEQLAAMHAGRHGPTGLVPPVKAGE